MRAYMPVDVRTEGQTYLRVMLVDTGTNAYLLDKTGGEKAMLAGATVVRGSAGAYTATGADGTVWQAQVVKSGCGCNKGREWAAARTVAQTLT